MIGPDPADQDAVYSLARDLAWASYLLTPLFAMPALYYGRYIEHDETRRKIIGGAMGSVPAWMLIVWLFL